MTGEPISLKRLDARPIATMSLEAQERHERREKSIATIDRGFAMPDKNGAGAFAPAFFVSHRGHDP